MALPLLFMLAGTLVRAATPTIARAIAQKGAKKIAESGIKNAIKKYGKPKNITSLSRVKNMKGSGASAAAKEVMKKFPVPKTKSNVGAKIVAGGATAVTGAAALGTKDKNKGKAKADVKTPKGVSQGSTTAKKKPTTMPKGVSQGSTAGTATTMTFGKAFRAAKDAGKKEFTYRGKRYNTRTKDEEKAMAKNQPLPKAKPKTTITKKKKVETPKNVSQGSTTAKKEAPKRKKGFLERFKEDFDKAVKETKRNFKGDAKKGTGRYKSVSTGKTNFNTKKKKAS